MKPKNGVSLISVREVLKAATVLQKEPLDLIRQARSHGHDVRAVTTIEAKTLACEFPFSVADIFYLARRP